MRILVPGCGGFIGSHFVERMLARDGVTIVGWDGQTSKISHLLDHPRLVMRQRLLKGPLAYAAFEEDVAGCDWIVNLAAICNPSQYNTEPLRTIYANFIDGYPIVELASKYKKPLVHYSTSEVYGRTLASYVSGQAYDNPDLYVLDAAKTPLVMGPVQNQRWTYATAKQLLERLVYAYHKETGLPFAVVRPFNFFGPRMDYLPGIEGEGKPRVLAMFVAAVLRNEPMLLVDGGRAKRTITSIHDAIDALVAIIDRPDQALNHFYNIGNPANEVSMRELALAVRSAFARVTGDERYLEHPIEEIDSEAFYGEGYEDCDRRVLDISAEQARLDWRPHRTLDELLDETVRYYWQKYGKPAGLRAAG
jgi:UDP-apiose/xylose synthase